MNPIQFLYACVRDPVTLRSPLPNSFALPKLTNDSTDEKNVEGGGEKRNHDK